MKRSVFFISDRTGITAEMVGNALLSQFETLEFDTKTIPFIDTADKAREAVAQINAAAERNGLRPVVFDTIVRPELREVIRTSNAMVMDFFAAFIGPLEEELAQKSSFTVGKLHGSVDSEAYTNRIDAVNYALTNDDGRTTRYYDQADLILVGVSRSGKTPTSLYLALQFGIRAANYPFTEEDMDEEILLPRDLRQYKDKLYGLSIDPARLHAIRTERRAGSKYASLPQCQYELKLVEELFRRERIPFVNTTSRSIEEIASKILADTGMKRHLF
ncbi:MAG: kinase/pyrophosphorylase [Gammaproteobacteria bacterium]|nr:kinase/pyrophosphorylase [Gammaproteobacteria bacterium]